MEWNSLMNKDGIHSETYTSVCTQTDNLCTPKHQTTYLVVNGLGEVRLPSLIGRAGERAAKHYVEFMASSIDNLHTRRAYVRAVDDLSVWCEDLGIELLHLAPVHVAAWRETMKSRGLAVPTVKQRLAAVRRLFDALVIGQVLPTNPAAATRGPKHSVRVGRTPVLAPDEARRLLVLIDAATPAGLRDRALIGLMVYSLARVGAALSMDVGDVIEKNRRLWVRLKEKGGKQHEMPCHHNLEDYLSAYLEGCGLAKGPLFRTIPGRSNTLSGTRMSQSDAYRMVQRRARIAGITTPIGNHTFRATGITAYLRAGGTLERAATMANHSSTRTTQLYDRRLEDVTLDEVERIGI